MADLYVYDTGSNTAPYDTVAKAATSLATAVLARGSGEKILMDYRHRENLSATVTYTPGTSSSTDPCVLRSVDTADSDAYRLPTDHQIYMDAAASSQDLKIGGFWLIEGCWFETTDDMTLGQSEGGLWTYDCKFYHLAGQSADNMYHGQISSINHIRAEFNFPRFRDSIRGVSTRFFGCTFSSGSSPSINGGGFFQFNE